MRLSQFVRFNDGFMVDRMVASKNGNLCCSYDDSPLHLQNELMLEC